MVNNQSFYEIAVNSGYNGTLSDFFQSITYTNTITRNSFLSVRGSINTIKYILAKEVFSTDLFSDIFIKSFTDAIKVSSHRYEPSIHTYTFVLKDMDKIDENTICDIIRETLNYFVGPMMDAFQKDVSFNLSKGECDIYRYSYNTVAELLCNNEYLYALCTMIKLSDNTLKIII